MKRGRGGVEYEDLETGTGPLAERGCAVEVEYCLCLNRGGRGESEVVPPRVPRCRRSVPFRKPEYDFEVLLRRRQAQIG